MKSFCRVFGLLCVAVLASGVLADQDKDSAPPVKVLPPNWAKLELSDQQKVQVYKIQEAYRAKIDELQKRIKELKVTERLEWEAVLTDKQKLLLEKLNSGNK